MSIDKDKNYMRISVDAGIVDTFQFTIINWVKRKQTHRIFASYVFPVGLISWIYKELKNQSQIRDYEQRDLRRKK